jgi:hypothetical protein
LIRRSWSSSASRVLCRSSGRCRTRGPTARASSFWCTARRGSGYAPICGRRPFSGRGPAAARMLRVLANDVRAVRPESSASRSPPRRGGGPGGRRSQQRGRSGVGQSRSVRFRHRPALQAGRVTPRGLDQPALDAHPEVGRVKLWRGRRQLLVSAQRAHLKLVRAPPSRDVGGPDVRQQRATIFSLSQRVTRKSSDAVCR